MQLADSNIARIDENPRKPSYSQLMLKIKSLEEQNKQLLKAAQEKDAKIKQQDERIKELTKLAEVRGVKIIQDLGSCWSIFIWGWRVL